MRVGWRRAALVLVMTVGAGMRAGAQASTIPSAQTGPSGTTSEVRGRALLDQMVAALGGDAWLNRRTWVEEGKVASFYKGQPNDSEFGYEAWTRATPFAERIVLISHFGVIIGTDHRDDAEVWGPETGYEITYKGKKPLKKEEVEDFNRRRAHTIDVAVKEWLRQPDVQVTYDGSGMSGRRLVDTVSLLTANNDAMTLQLDETTHLPLSRSYQYRDPVFKDLDTDVEQYDNYQPWQGVQTPMTVTRLHNGDMVSQRFLTKVSYNVELAPELFDPDRPLVKKK